MILTRDFYAVKCDRCGAISKSLDGKMYFTEEFIATYEAEKHGYKRKYASDFCQNCHVVDRVTEKPMRDCFEGLEKDIFYRSIVPTDKDDKEIFEETAGTIYDILKKYPKP